MRSILTVPPLLALLALSLPALASDEHCAHAEPRQLDLDVAGVKAVVFEVGAHDLKVESRPGAAASISGRACASHADRLSRLKLEQHRRGDKLVVRMYQDGAFGGIFLGNHYAYLKLAATLPDDIAVQLKVGSGDAEATGAPVLSADVGSGDAVGRNIRGLAAVSVGSGDVEIHDAGSLKVVSVGSGDAKAERIRGGVEVGSIGSGDFKLTGAGGNVRIGSIGSGGATLRSVDGDVAVRSIGSGEVDVRGVRGALTVDSVGSGDVDHQDIDGPVQLPKRN